MGIDFNLFNHRLRGTLDYYNRVGTDLFARKRLDPSSGFSSMVINNAGMKNTGFELSLGFEWIRSESQNGLRWSSTLNAAYNKNRITYVDQTVTNPFVLVDAGGFVTGDPVRSIYSFPFAGLDSTGLPEFFQPNGTRTKQQLNTINSVIFSGSVDPKYNAALNNEVSFKGFSLNVYAVYYGGHYFRGRPAPVPLQSIGFQALPNYLLDSWTPTNTNTDVQGNGKFYQFSGAGLTQYQFADILVRPADFIKVRNIVLGYDLPRNITSKIKANNIRLRFQVNNPKALWTKQDHDYYDPETGIMPIPASYIIGINTKF